MPRVKNYLVRTFFEKRSEKHVVCKNEKCNNKLLNLHAGNLERHLKTFHPTVYYNYLQRKNNNILNRTRKDDSTRLSCSVNKKHVQMALIELFTKCGRPLSLAEDQPFKIMVNPLLDGLNIKLSEQSIMDNIAVFSLNLKKELKEELCGKLITLKLDTVTRSLESLFSVSVQFIKNNNIILKALGIKQLSPQHSSETVKSLVMEVLNDYNINLEQVVTITADYSNEPMKADHDLNYDLNNGLNGFCAQGDAICMDLDLFVDGISYIPSGAHTLQMCIVEVLESTVIKNELDVIRKIMKKLRTQFYVELIKIRNCVKPILDNNSNWTSTYRMVESFVELKNFVEEINQDIAAFDIPPHIWSFADEFLSVFKVFYDTLQKLQREHLLYSDLYIEITNITIQLQQPPKSCMKFALTDSLNRQKLKLFEQDLFVTAVFLDPRIKVCLVSDQCNRAKSCIMQLYTRLLFLRDNDTKSTGQTTELCDNTAASASSAASVMSGNAEDALEEYFKAFDQIANNSIFTTSRKIEQDILAYGSQGRLGIKENIVEFWNKQANALSEIAHLVLGIPCTQVSLQRLFSALDYIQDNRDGNQSSANLEHILLVQSNGEFIYN